MKSLLEKLNINKDVESNEFSSYMKAFVEAKKKANKTKENYIVYKDKTGSYYIAPNHNEYKVGDTFNKLYTVLEVVNIK